MSSTPPASIEGTTIATFARDSPAPSGTHDHLVAQPLEQREKKEALKRKKEALRKRQDAIEAEIRDLEEALERIGSDSQQTSSAVLAPSPLPDASADEGSSRLTLTSSSDPNLLPFSARSTSSAFSSSSRDPTPTPSPALRTHHSVPDLHLTSPSHLSPFQFSSGTPKISTGPVGEAAFEPQDEAMSDGTEGGEGEEKEDGEEKKKEGEWEGESAG